MITCTRRFGFDSGHRILGHESKCGFLHGHRYECEVTCEAQSGGLDSLGRVIDFGVIKEVCGDYINTYLDHKMILHIDDPMFKVILHDSAAPISPFNTGGAFWLSDNPTAENIAKHLYNAFNALLLSGGIKVTKIKLWETPNCFVEYQPKPPVTDTALSGQAR